MSNATHELDASNIASLFSINDLAEVERELEGIVEGYGPDDVNISQFVDSLTESPTPRFVERERYGHDPDFIDQSAFDSIEVLDLDDELPVDGIHLEDDLDVDDSAFSLPDDERVEAADRIGRPDRLKIGPLDADLRHWLGVSDL